MALKFDDKTVWITGASSGIGEALARALQPIAGKIIISARSKDKLETIANEDPKFHVLPMDMADKSSIDHAVDQLKAEGIQVDILVNNAGVSQRARAMDTEEEVERRIMEVNYFGPVHLTKKLLPGMLERAYGQLVIISSITGKFGFPLRTSYSASKHALQGYFESLRAEYEGRGISVNMIYPGRIKTSISMNAMDGKGEKHAQLDDGQAGGMPAHKCASKIIRAMRRNKRETLIGGKELNMVWIRKFMPGLFFKIVKRIKPT